MALVAVGDVLEGSDVGLLALFALGPAFASVSGSVRRAALVGARRTDGVTEARDKRGVFYPLASARTASIRRPRTPPVQASCRRLDRLHRFASAPSSRHAANPAGCLIPVNQTPGGRAPSSRPHGRRRLTR